MHKTRPLDRRKIRGLEYFKIPRAFADEECQETCAKHAIFGARSNLLCNFLVLPRVEATDDSRLLAAAWSSSLRSHLALPAHRDFVNSAFSMFSCPCGYEGVGFRRRASLAQYFGPCVCGGGLWVRSSPECSAHACKGLAIHPLSLDDANLANEMDLVLWQAVI